MTPVHLGLIALIDVLWAINIVAVKIVVDAAQPITGTALRYITVLAACLPWMRWLPGRMPLVMPTGIIAGALFLGLGGLSFAAATNVSALAIAWQLGVPPHAGYLRSDFTLPSWRASFPVMAHRFKTSHSSCGWVGERRGTCAVLNHAGFAGGFSS